MPARPAQPRRSAVAGRRRWRGGRCRHGGRRRRRRSAAPARRKGSAVRSAPGQASRSPRRAAASATSASRIGHHRLVGRAGAVPLDHGEFRRMQRPALAVAEDAGEIDDLRPRRRRAASSWRIRARCGDSAVAAPPSGPISSVAKAWRWASLPGETWRAAGSTIEEPLRLEPARGAPPRSGSAPGGTGGGRRWRSVDQKGEGRRAGHHGSLA